MNVCRAYRSFRFVGCALLVMLITGCASSTPRTTRLTLSDYQLTISETKAKLQEAKFFSERTPSSPPAVITIDKVENLTTDLIPTSEQWMFVLSVWNDPGVQQLARAKNVTTQVRPERLREMQQMYPTASSEFTSPTHLLSATFRTATRITAKAKSEVATDRVEQYQLEYSLTRIQSGAIEWTGLVEFKRAAKGTVIN